MREILKSKILGDLREILDEKWEMRKWGILPSLKLHIARVNSHGVS